MSRAPSIAALKLAAAWLDEYDGDGDDNRARAASVNQARQVAGWLAAQAEAREAKQIEAAAIRQLAEGWGVSPANVRKRLTAARRANKQKEA